MSTSLQVLMVGESETFLSQIKHKFQDSGYALRVKQIETLEAMVNALKSEEWKMVIVCQPSPYMATEFVKTLQSLEIFVPYLIVPAQTPEKVVLESALYQSTLAVEHFVSHEANLFAILENTPDAVWSVDINYRILILNSVFKRQFQSIFGMAVTIGTNVIVGLPPAERSIWQEYYDRALAGERFAVEMRFQLPDLPSHLEVSFCPIRSETGEITGTAVFGRDISDHKQAEEALQQARDQLQAVLDAVPGCVSWFSSDLRYLGINRYLAATFNVRPENFIGKKLGFMESSPGFAEFVRDFITSPLKEGSVEIAAQVDGIPRSYLIVAQKYAQDQAAVFVGLDITDRRQFEEALRESQERYVLAMQGANDGLWDWNLKTNTIYFSPRWKAMLGYGEAEIGNRSEEWFNRVHPEEFGWLQAQLKAHLDGLTRHFEIEHRMRHKDGRYRWMLTRGLAVRDENRRAYRMAGSQTDITERKRAEEQLLYDALHDGLTRLANRALFTDRLGRAIDRAKRKRGYQFAVLCLDLDRFKVVNDSLGHNLGDQLLVAIARRLQTCIRAGDTLARLGGDEFTILMEDLHDPGDPHRLADAIQRVLKSPFTLNQQDIFATVSIGIALYDDRYDRPEDLLRNADTAMYRAKAMGRACHAMFDQEMHSRAVALLQLETDLRRAIAIAPTATSREFQIYYQPIVQLETGKISGFEALVRWQHPDQGMISPGEFIPVAEDTGLIVALGQWILTHACEQLQHWKSIFPYDQPLSISVNLSTRQFAQPDLVHQVKQILTDTNFQLDLKLEITESAIMDNPEAAIALLQELKSLGVQLLLDDFGTGYSSLSYLHRFPFDTVKVDQSFVSSMSTNDDSRAIVKAIVSLAHHLEMNIIAEGVETAEQMEQLKLLGAEYGQGYYFAKPLPAAEIENLLALPPHWLVQKGIA